MQIGIPSFLNLQREFDIGYMVGSHVGLDMEYHVGSFGDIQRC